MAVFCEVDGAEEVFAGFAAFHTDVRKLLGGVNRQLVLILLAAVGTQQAAEFPFGEAERAEQEAFRAVAFGSQHGSDGLLPAERANGLDAAFDLRGVKGISNWIVGDATLDEILYPSPVPNLTVRKIPATYDA